MPHIKLTFFLFFQGLFVVKKKYFKWEGINEEAQRYVWTLHKMFSSIKYKWSLDYVSYLLLHNKLFQNLTTSNNSSFEVSGVQEQLGWVALVQVTHEVTAQLSPGTAVMVRSVRAKPLPQAHSQGCCRLHGSSLHGPLHRDVHGVAACDSRGRGQAMREQERRSVLLYNVCAKVAFSRFCLIDWPCLLFKCWFFSNKATLTLSSTHRP